MRTALEWLAYHRNFWASVLDALARHLEPESKTGFKPKKTNS